MSVALVESLIQPCKMNNRLHPLRVVVLADSAHCPQGLSVFIGVGGVDVVQRGGVGGVSIATCEVNTHSEVDLTSSHDVVQEGVDMGGLGREGGGEREREVGREGEGEGIRRWRRKGLKGDCTEKCFANVKRPLDNEARE